MTLQKIIKEQEEEFDRRFIGRAEKEGNNIRFHGGIDPVVAIEIKDFIKDYNEKIVEAVCGNADGSFGNNVYRVDKN